MRNIMQDWMIQKIGLPYFWGGSSSIQGYDCSGLAQEFLTSFGAHPNPKLDHTAQALYRAFINPNMSSPNIYDTGALLFFGQNESSITHVAICLNDKLLFEAGGGGSKTISIAEAVKANAFVRIRPVDNRKDLIACLMPKKIMGLL